CGGKPRQQELQPRVGWRACLLRGLCHRRSLIPGREESPSLRASPTGRYCHGRWGNNCRYKPIMAGSVVSMGWPREGVTATIASNGEFARLSALIARQRRELDRMQSAAAARSVADLARGMLMERLPPPPPPPRGRRPPPPPRARAGGAG